MDKIPQSFISRARAFLFKGPRHNGQTHSDPFPLLTENKFRYDFFKRQFQYPKFVLSPSYHLKQRYEAEGYREILFLPLGFHQTDRVETPPFNGQLKIAFIGNIERHKGVAVILKELLTLQKLDRLKINIHGRAKDPTYFSEITRFARQYPKAMIEFHGGYRSDQDLKGIFSQNHVMVFPSIWEENAPLVVREALLHGVPVIGSKLGGVPEIIEDGANGFLFDPFVEGDLLKIIQQILDDPDMLEKITQGARNTQIERMADHVLKITNLYNSVLSDN
jgi:glycosyltransferase involved in cell wall biosynthesis